MHFPEDTEAKNQLGVAHLLLGDNKAAKRVYEEVGEAGGEHLLPPLLLSDWSSSYATSFSLIASPDSSSSWSSSYPPLPPPPPQVLSSSPDDGFAQVHYGFILKSENKIAESISYLQVCVCVCVRARTHSRACLS